MKPALVADAAQGRVSRSDADAEAELVAEPAPLADQSSDAFAHFDRHAYRALSRIGTGDRIVEDDQQAVAGEMLQRALEAVDLLAETAVVVLQHGDDVLGLGALGERGEAAQVAEHDRYIAAVAFQERVVAGRHHELGDLRRQKALEPVHAAKL